ncbi:MAG: hypothetical protein ABJA82_14335 [Myxococcales bacterium]
METDKRRVGRPKRPPRTGPLVLQESRSRESVTVQIHSDTARELAEYAGWVEHLGALTNADATFTTVEFALREVFRRDRVWQERRRREAGKREEAKRSPASTSVGTAAPTPPPIPPVSAPAPASRPPAATPLPSPSPHLPPPPTTTRTSS